MCRTTIKCGIMLISCLILQSSALSAEFAGGTGEPNDPYQIATAGDLILLGESPEYYYKHFILTADIDLDPNLPGRKVFEKAVIAPDTDDASRWEFDGASFTGVFDGSGYTISHLTITGVSYLGLFGRLGTGAKISNLGMEAIDVNGTGFHIGGLVGENYRSSIISSYSTGTVSGGDRYVGGLVGENSGSITACYSTCVVIGGSYVGGLVGRNNGNIAMSYSAGKVTVITWDAGGLVGYNYYGGITSSFWDVETSGQDTSDGGTGLTTNKMQNLITFLNAGWDVVGKTFNGTCDYWQISSGDYPRLRSHSGDSLVIPEGLGTSQEPYLIRDTRDLGTVWFRPTAHYRLEASLDISGIKWSMAVIPWFGGTFDGNNHVISNLHIQGGEYQGLFGQLGSGAIISNLGLDAVDINGTADYVGGLVGYNFKGNITTSFSTGTVSGENYVGGLVGDSDHGSITSCYSTGAISGDDNVGGLVGQNWYGNIDTSSSTGAISGDDNVGGLVGQNWYGNIDTCSSAGTISGDDNVGGLIGSNDNGSIISSYSMGKVTGTNNVGGHVGLNRSNITSCYNTGSVTGTGENVGGLVGSNYWYYGLITTSCSTGAVIGDKNVGGLVGKNRHSDIISSYSTGKVTGNQGVGGLVGVNWGYITTSYSTGAVRGDSEIGGLTGSGGSASYERRGTTICFWDTQTSGQATSIVGMGKTTAEMQTATTFLEAGWDFVDEPENGTEDIWWILEGRDYPRLWWELIEDDVVVIPEG